MFTTGSKLYFGLAAAAIVGAAVYGYGTDGGLLGVATLGFYGGAGEHVGYIVLLAAALASALIGGVVIAARDADADQVATYARLESVPEVPAPEGASYWPAIGALAVAIGLVGLVVNTQLFILGVVLTGITLAEWMVRAWSDRVTGDPATNRKIRNRLMYPIEVPVFGALAIFFVVLGVSRLLLSLSKNGSAIAAIAVAVVILVTAIVMSAAPKAGRAVLGVVLSLAAVGVLAAGVIGAARGERNFGGEEHQVQFTPADRNQQPGSALVQSGSGSEQSTSSSSTESSK